MGFDNWDATHCGAAFNETISAARRGRRVARDLWRHAETAISDEIAADVPPHGTAPYRVSG
jgi:hypothetical protein